MDVKRLVTIGIIIVFLSVLCFFYFQPANEKKVLLNSKVNIEEENKLIRVEVRGAVVLPGTYNVPDNWTLAKLLKMCGVDIKADLTQLPLNAYLIHQNMYYIPYQMQTDLKPYLYLNINAANIDELVLLPQIGEVTAQAIIAYRMVTPFTKIEDIKKVKGIGDITYEKIKPFIFV